jgi:hypothetical protein
MTTASAASRQDANSAKRALVREYRWGMKSDDERLEGQKDLKPRMVPRIAVGWWP